jgi:alpha-D-ribose 1-methylphosphonate 5-triphosphate synthase subunit PhnH
MTLSPGFADPVANAQSCFRAVLDAMARPGRIQTVTGITAPAPLCDSAAAVLLTVADHETPIWLDPAAEPARPWIGFHTGAAILPALDQALFAMALSWPDLSALRNGTDEAPETAATLILQVASLQTGHTFVLTGPGLRAPARLAVTGLPPDFAAIWQRNHALFPRGIDLILCCGDQLTALPRSVSIKDA